MHARRGCELSDTSDIFPFETLVWMLDEADGSPEVLAICEREEARKGWSEVHRIGLLTSKCIALVNLGQAHNALCQCLWQVEQCNEASLWEVYATALAQLDRWGEALRAIRRAEQLQSEVNDREQFRRRREVLEHSVSALEAMIDRAKAEAEARPRDWQALHELGLLWMRCGDLSTASEFFERAREQHPAYDGDDRFSVSKWAADCQFALLSRRGLPMEDAHLPSGQVNGAEEEEDIPF